MLDTIRILIVDDHVAFRNGLRAMLKSATDLEVVAEATAGAQAVALALQRRWQVADRAAAIVRRVRQGFGKPTAWSAPTAQRISL